jgi:broad specificity phosphatase PhoE
MPPTFIFIRHGEALHNVSARYHGPIAYTLPENEDAPLSEEGHSQTLQAGKEIANLIGDSPVHIYCSPLTRCIQTAENVGGSLNVKIKCLDDLLIERLGDGHVCNNRKSFHCLQETFPDWYMDHIYDPPAMPLERESLKVVEERMQEIWNWIFNEYRNTDHVVLIVSHEESLRSLHNRNFKNAEYLVINQ